MHSAACVQASQRLSRQEGTGAAGQPGAAPAALQAARRDAAVACLGVAALKPQPRAGVLREPESVPPVNGAALRAGPAPAGPAPAGSPPAQRPGVVSVTSCDANGCWASDGTRLTRSGGALLGPRGVCTTAGAVVNCP